MQRILENNSVCETDPKMKVTLRENERKEREVWYSPLGCNGNQYENLIKHIKWGEFPIYFLSQALFLSSMLPSPLSILSFKKICHHLSVQLLISITKLQKNSPLTIYPE